MSEEVKPEDIEAGMQIGQKRLNTENGGPASKKANLAESDTVQIKVLIPSAAVGALIGKGGETMRNLKNETGCRVQMSKNQEVYHGTSERICLVKGKVSSTMIVVAAILEKIQEKIEANHPADPFDLKGLDRTKEIKFIVPNTSAGMVIGKNGTSIKEIREITTANIQIYPKAGTEEAKLSTERVITVGHESNEVLINAAQRVLEKVASDPLHAQPIQTDATQSLTSSFDFTSASHVGGATGGTAATQFGGISSIAGNSAWQSQPALDQSLGKTFNSTPVKFNPLQGTGNNELLAFLDNLQSTLRSSGFNDQSVSEVMQAMQVLAKYNIMGLGLGLGVAAMAQMRNTENVQQQQQNTLVAGMGQSNAVATLQQPSQQRYETQHISHTQQQSGLISSGTFEMDQNIGGRTTGVLIDVLADKKANSGSGGNVQSNVVYANLVKELIVEDGHIELEVPDNIIGAVLGPRAKTLIEIQQMSGAKIEVHKRGSPTSSPGGRLVSLTGENNAIVNGRMMIEKVINQEQQRRTILGTR